MTTLCRSPWLRCVALRSIKGGFDRPRSSRHCQQHATRAWSRQQMGKPRYQPHTTATIISRASASSMDSQEVPNRIQLDSPLPFPAVTCAIRQVLYISHRHRTVAWLVVGSFYDIHGYRVWSTERFLFARIPEEPSPRSPEMNNGGDSAPELRPGQGKFASSSCCSGGESAPRQQQSPIQSL